MTTYPFDLTVIDPSWTECVNKGLAKLDPHYLTQLARNEEWLPGPEKIFNAFTLPLNQVNYVLLGESPYPRHESANGYAFWDASVHELWSPTGLSKRVNRATSLRNILKMLLITEGMLDPHYTGQEAIAKINKETLVKTNDEFFENFIRRGFLLLNATPVLQSQAPQKDARAWYPFLGEIIHCLLQKRPTVQFILLGRIATVIDTLLADHPEVKKLQAEHPYNLSFIHNADVWAFFKSLHLLRKTQ